jgi:WD40 repeat protein
MTGEPHRSSFVAFGFDYAESEEWSDLPHLRVGIGRLAEAWSASMRRDLSDLSATASPTTVMSALEELLFDRLTPEDSIVIYLGGHGARLGDEHFIVGPKARSEALTARSGVSATDLAQVISQSNPRQVALFIDTCYSGAGAAHVAAVADTVVSRERRVGNALFVVSSAQPLGSAVDGAFLAALLDVLSDPAPTLWSENDERVAPREMARMLRLRHGDFFESRERGYVEALLPNLACRDVDTVDLETEARTREHFLRAASSLDVGEVGWHFAGRTAPLTAIADWLQEETSGVFVLTGPPGSGKSAIMGHVALLASSSGREEVAQRYMAFEPLAPTTPILGSVSVAIHAREKTLKVIVGEISRGLGMMPLTSDRDELLARASERTEQTCVLVDALDEAAGAMAVPIAELLRDLADLPGLKVLVATRADRARATSAAVGRAGPIIHALEPARVWDLASDSEGSQADVVEYVEGRLGDELSGSPYRGQGEAIRAIANAIAQRVGGVFLYARLMVQMLLNEPPLRIEHGWEARLPGSKGGDLFAMVVDEDLGRIPAAVRDRVRDMLMAVAWAEGEGLPRYRVWPALTTAITGRPFADADATDTLQYASWYLVESTEAGQSVYRLHHEELVRYFRAATHGGPGQEIQQRIALALTNFAGQGGVGWLNTNAYVRRHLSAHAARGRVIETLVGDLGFLGAADPSRLASALDLYGMEAAATMGGGMRAFLRLGADRVGPTIGQRLANLTLECATEEPDSQLEDGDFSEVVPWTVLFDSGRPTTFSGMRHPDVGDMVTLACGPLAGGLAIATASHDHRVQLWDGRDGELMLELEGHRDVVRGIAVCEIDGADRVVSGGADGVVSVWDPMSGKRSLIIEGEVPVGSVSVASSTRGAIVAAGCDDGTIRTWDATTGEQLGELAAHADRVTSTACATIDGARTLASGGLDRVVGVWDPRTGEKQLTLTGPAGSILDVALGHVEGHAIVAAASSDESVWIWNAQSGAVMQRMERHAGAALCVCFGIVEDVPIIASGSADLTIRIWDCRSGECLYTLNGHSGGVRAIALGHSDGRPLLISGGADRTICFWDPRTGESVAPVARHAGGSTTSIWSLGFSSTLKRGGEDVHRGAVRDVAIGAIEGRPVVASGSLDEQIQVRDAVSGDLIGRWNAHTGGVHALAFSELEGRSTIASGGYDGAVRIWDADDRSLRVEFTGHTRAVWGVACGVLDGRPIVVSGSRDRSVRVWDVGDGRNIHCLTGTRERVWGVAFGLVDNSPVIAAASTDRSIWMWDARSGELLRRLHGYARGTRCLAFCEFDRRTVLIAAGADGTIRVWDAATGGAIATLRGHTDGVWAVSTGFYSDRLVMVSASDDLTVRVWDVAAARSFAIPQATPAYAVDFSQGCLAVGTDRHVYCIRFQSPLFGEMSG